MINAESFEAVEREREYTFTQHKICWFGNM